MNYCTFIRLPQESQFEVTRQLGTYLTRVEKYNIRISLYSLGDFYVEVAKEAASGMPLYLTPHRSLQSADHLLETIDISSLWK